MELAQKAREVLIPMPIISFSVLALEKQAPRTEDFGLNRQFASEEQPDASGSRFFGSRLPEANTRGNSRNSIDF
jgi:hypothetical protein